MLKALLDTNQLVSSLLSSQGLQRRLIDAWRARSFVRLLAPGQLEEIGDVLARPKIARKYRIAPSDRDGFSISCALKRYCFRTPSRLAYVATPTTITFLAAQRSEALITSSPATTTS